MGTGCPDLKQLFATRYRVSWDESRKGSSTDPWFYVIQGRFGHIFPWGHDTLAVWTTRSTATKNLLIKAGCTLRQDGDREWTLTFPIHLFPVAAKAIKAYRKRKVTPAQRAVLLKQAMANKSIKGID